MQKNQEKNMLNKLQEILPLSVKTKLKPLYRLIYPNKLHAMFFPTFRCSYRCSYCPYCSQFDYLNIYPKNVEKTPEEWLAVFEKLLPTTFFIIGGEPFVYNGLDKIINEMPKKHSILGLVTNCSMPTSLYEKIEKPMHMNISFHREFAQEDEFIEKVINIKKLHHVAVNIVAVPDNIPFIPKLQKVMKENQIELHIDPYFGNDFKYTEEQLKALPFSNERTYSKKYKLHNSLKMKNCSAGRNFYCIMPNGEALACTSGMDYIYSDLRKEDAKDFNTDIFKIGNVFDENFQLNKHNINCNLSCFSHCDMDFCSIKEVK